jgi:hypothetical protein
VVTGGTEALLERLGNEVGEIHWSGLERHFARGALVWVDPDQDLVQVALGVVQDDTAMISALMEEGGIRGVTTEDAAAWQRGGATLRALVAAPWVLVQPLT